MGANLNRLMQAYGVYTPTVSAYSGVANPDAPKAGATAAERGTYQGSLADYTAQQDAFKQYEQDYKNRIATTDLYTSPRTASTFLSTPNYSAITGMRANLSDTTSADTTDYTNPNFSSMINDAYRSLGRVGIGTDTSNIDQPGYNYWMGQLQAGANGGIAPSNFKNQFKTSTNDYIRQYPNNDYTNYIKGYLGLLPATTLPTTGVDENSGDTGYTGGTGDTGAYRGGTVKSPKSMEDALLRDRSRHEFSDPSFEETYGKYFYRDGGGVIGTGTRVSSLLSSDDPAGLPQVTASVNPPQVTASVNPPQVTAPALGGGENDDSDRQDALMRRVFNSDEKQGGPPQPQITPQQRPPDAVPVVATSTGVDNISGFYDPDANLGKAPDAVTPAVAVTAAPGKAPGAVTPDASLTYEAQREELLKKYLSSPRTSPEMLAARQTAREAQANFVKMLNDQSSGETGPSEAERYFRLAAAMLAPTKTGKGAFWEAAGIASDKMADFERSTTNSQNAAKTAKLQRMLKANEITWQVAKEELASIRAQEEGDRKDNLAFRLEELKDRREQTNPKTDIHNQLIGRGFVRGTPPYKAEYDRLTALDEEAAKIKLDQAKQNYHSLTATEQKDLLGSERGLVEFEASMKKLQEALDINDKTLPTGSFAGQGEDVIKTKLGSNDPLVVNTARQAIMLSLVGLGKLKSTFPGAISDKETAIMTKLQGINSATLEGRKRIIAGAIVDLEELKKEMVIHIDQIKARHFRTYNPPSTSTGATP